MLNQRLNDVPGIEDWERHAASDGSITLRWKKADTATDPTEVTAACSVMVRELKEWGIVQSIAYRPPGSIGLEPLLTAEEKLYLSLDNKMTAQDRSILAAGPLVRRGQGFLPFRIVLRDWSGSWVTHRQIIPDGTGSGFKPSFDAGDYRQSWDSALDNFFDRIRKADKLSREQ